jgi:Tol biopolymer transport system component
LSGAALSKILRIGLLLLLLSPAATSDGGSAGQLLGLNVSPDGKFVATTFVKDNSWRIYKIDVNTGNATRLTDAAAGEESSPTFPPDGKLIAYSYVSGKDQQRIIVMNVDGSNPRTLPGAGTAKLDATFAPDGEKIYFRRAESRPREHAWDIFSMGVDGSSLTQLTHEALYEIYEPSLSSDGKSMVVVTEGWDAPQQQIAIYALDHPEKPQRILRPQLPAKPSANLFFESPNYMPDGKSILFIGRSRGKRVYDCDVYRLNLETGSVERLTEGNGYAGGLKLFPDGETAVFLRWHEDSHGTTVGTDLWLLDLQTRKVTPLEVSGLN